MHNELLVLSRDKDRVAAWRSGVSLHSHTRHSQESLGFIATLLGGRNLTRRWYACQKEQCLRTTGMALDLEHAYWTPPLCERMAQELEQRQIEGLGLRAMVSITDHNSIDACELLREDAAHSNAPLSTEWTVPFGGAVFHFGIHNLPTASAHDLMAAMHQATFLADEERILKLFGEISETPGVLVVFNHPLWNFYSIPADQFQHELTRFLKAANRYVHAFELNGMRNHAENRGVLQLAVDWNQVLISGRPAWMRAECFVESDQRGGFSGVCGGDSLRPAEHGRRHAAVCDSLWVAFVPELLSRRLRLSWASGRTAAVG